MPLTPQKQAGSRIEPPVSDPRATMASPAATAAAEPPLEPPGILSRSQGFRVAPQNDVSVDDPIANSSMFAFPRITMPSSLIRRTTVASYGGTKFSRIL